MDDSTHDASHKPVQTGKDLLGVLRGHDVVLGLPDQLLDAQEALPVQVRAEALVDLAQHELAELGVLIGRRLEDGVDEAGGQQLGGGDAAAHEEGLVGLGIAQAQDQGAAGAALGDEAQRAKGREQEGVRGAVDEVGVGDQGGGEANDGAVEADDEDLGVGVEGLGDIEVVG